MFFSVSKDSLPLQLRTTLRFFPLRLALFCILLFHINAPVLYGQCGTPTISLTGDACVGGVLKAATNTAASSVIWKVNDSKMVAIQTVTPPANGVTVAGGNGGGSNNSQLSNPARIYIDKAGNLFIADMNNARIQKWDPVQPSVSLLRVVMV